MEQRRFGEAGGMGSGVSDRVIDGLFSWMRRVVGAPRMSYDGGGDPWMSCVASQCSFCTAADGQ
jgi:hypothetical protein